MRTRYFTVPSAMLGHQKYEDLMASQAEDGSGIIHAKGKSVNVMVGLVAKKSAEVPEWLSQHCRHKGIFCLLPNTI